MATAIEFDKRLQRNLGGNVVRVLGLLELLNCSIIPGNTGVVMAFMVKFHNLAGDGGF